MSNTNITTALKAVALTAGAFTAARYVFSKLASYELAGKTVLITGGSRGLGLVLAREFARQHARVVICARDAEELERARLALLAYETEVRAIRCDVTREDEVANMVSQIEEHFGSVDVLINNAGLIQVGPLDVMTRED